MSISCKTGRGANANIAIDVVDSEWSALVAYGMQAFAFCSGYNGSLILTANINVAEQLSIFLANALAAALPYDLPRLAVLPATHAQATRFAPLALAIARADKTIQKKLRIRNARVYNNGRNLVNNIGGILKKRSVRHDLRVLLVAY